MIQRNEASQRQVDAADPAHSKWLAANAGSGKTRVLTDRVARLLLQGVQPERILCLTYTKAAASEMQNRLFKRLGAWAMLDDATLSEALIALGHGTRLSPADLSRARTLFALAIEAPGGLKIQTIHSFCAALLRRFPLEAGVSPQFAEIDDQAARQLRTDVVEAMASGEDLTHVVGLAAHLTDQDFDGISAEILRNREAFDQRVPDADMWGWFGLSAGFDETDLTRLAFDGDEDALIRAVLPYLEAGKSTDQKAARLLQLITTFDHTALDQCEKLFLTGEKTKEPFSPKITSFPTKDCRAAMPPDVLERLQDLMLRIGAARPVRLGLLTARRTRALHDFARNFLARYDQQKQARGWLDFDDLIRGARDLLNDPAVAAWVLYRLDGGLDHILVDEAQDTSPVQWQVIERLAQEFTAGLGARPETRRTLFVVGDKKQSIYSFQGADPGEFDRMQAEFRDRLKHTPMPLVSTTLDYSFRSAPVILELVDATFDTRIGAGFVPDTFHKAFKSRMSGQVDLWPVIEPAEKPDPGDWEAPVDMLGAEHHTVKLARRIAGQIDRMLRDGDLIAHDDDPSLSRPVQAGDFLILVQRRSDLFHQIIAACKARNLPIAGSDRLKVGAELAVRDLVALLSFLATPEDNLSLAVVLKSPLFGWSEAQLYDLAHTRAQPLLWQALRKRDDPETVEVLNDLLGQIDFLRPYELLERILTRHQGRQLLLGRLGIEAADGIDALLAQALSYEQGTVPSLTGFLTWFETDDLEIKRTFESDQNQIRVMTVHGSKGLEAPIVILPDTAKRDIRITDMILRAEDRAIWKPPSAQMPDMAREAVSTLRRKQTEERDRLLYVAMTRAEKRLIVAAAGDLGKDGQSWYSAIQRGMEARGALPTDFIFEGGDHGPGLHLTGGQQGPVHHAEPKARPQDQILPDWVTRPATPADPAPKPLSPSVDLGGAKALPGEAGQDEDTAKALGHLVHVLLEHLPRLPAPARPGRAADLARAQGADPDTQIFADAMAHVTRVLQAPDLAHIFAPETLSEVPVTADLPSLHDQRIHGIIDRLIVGPDQVLAVDFKTNAIVPDTPQTCPDGLLRQMGAYRDALRLIFPDHNVETAILWTTNAKLMQLPHDLVTLALATTTSLDVPPVPS